MSQEDPLSLAMDAAAAAAAGQQQLQQQPPPASMRSDLPRPSPADGVDARNVEGKECPSQ